MNDRTHADLLEQVADSREEAAAVRRILGGLTEADLDAQQRWKRAPFAIGAANHAHRHSRACSRCESGMTRCATPEACERAEGRPATERGDIYRVLAMATWPLYFMAIGAFFAWLLS